MKYDDNHPRDFEGAKGKCEVCGLEVTLDWQDKPTKLMDNTWRVRCPHCDAFIRCHHTRETAK